MFSEDYSQSYNRFYEPYDLLSVHKNKLNTCQPHKQIIREYDWEKLPNWFIQKWQVRFSVLTKDYFESQYLWYSLQGEKKFAGQYALYEYPERMINNITNFPCWLPIYREWLIKYNSQREMVIRTHINNPDTRLGLGVFTEIK